MLDEAERLRLIELFLPTIIESGRGALVTALVDELRANLPHEPNSRSLLAGALDLCERDGRRLQPPALSRFIRNMAPFAIGHQEELERLAQRLSLPPPAAPDPFRDLIIRVDIPFLDRDPLRNEVRKLLQPQAPRPILVVNGHRFSGKSFTSRFIDHLARANSLVRHCIVEVADGDVPTVLDVARDMMTKLGSSPDLLPLEQTNAARWPQELANTVWLEVCNLSKNWNGGIVLILDGLGHLGAGAPTEPSGRKITEFVLRLADHVRRGAHSRHHRLIMIDYDPAHLAVYSQDVRSIRLDTLSAAEARAELTRLFSGLGRPGDTDALVDAVMDGMDEHIRDMRPLGSRCSQMIESLID